MRQIWKQITGGGQGAGTDAPLAGEIDVADFAEALTAGSDLAIPAIRRVLADGSLEGADVGLYCFAADTARSLGHADLAIALLDQADATLEPSAAICEKRGFVALERRDLDDAAAAFRRGTEIDAAFLPNWYGLTLALHALGETDAALTAAGHVLDWDGKYAPEAFAAVVGDLATEAYTRGQRLPLRAAYAYLHAAGHGPIATIRYIDILNKSHERRLAREAVETLDLAHQRMGKWETCIVAEALIGGGDLQQARTLAESLLTPKGFDVHFLRTYLNTFRNPDEVRGSRSVVMARFADGPQEMAGLVALTLQFAAGDVEGAVDAYRAASQDVRRQTAFSALAIAYRLLELGRSAEAHALADALSRDGFIPFHVRLLRINLAFADQDWDAAAALMEDIAPQSRRDQFELQLKRFELACFTGKFDEARALEEGLLAAPQFGAQALPPILRFRSETKEWDAVCDIFLDHGLPTFRFVQLGDVIFRAFTKAGRDTDLVARIEATEDWQSRADLCRLRAALIEHRAETAADIRRMLADPTAAADPVVRNRLRTKLRYLPAPDLTTDPADRALFFCTNTSYRRGTAVAVAMLLRRSVDLARAVTIYVVTDEADGVSERVFARIGETFGCRIATVPVGAFMDDFSRLDPSYGVFTSGHELSQAAYYRIFFARKLAEDAKLRRAAYLDSDIAVVGDVSALLERDMEDKPLAARREVIRPEVIHAAASHGMPAEDYFNSGILGFDMAHAGLKDGLAAAIDAIQTRRLFFHDQCALNIGFMGQVSYLPQALNFFVPPDVAPSMVAEDAAILHYLDRPKPWEATYVSRVGLEWLGGYDSLVSMIGPDLTHEMFKVT